MKRRYLKTIRLDIPVGIPLGRCWTQTAQVDWFRPRTERQIMANALAYANGESEPYPDPNRIEVMIRPVLAGLK